MTVIAVRAPRSHLYLHLRSAMVGLVVAAAVVSANIASAQDSGQECPVFEFGLPGSREIDRPTVSSDKIESAIATGCKVVLSDVRIDRELVLSSPPAEGHLAVINSTFEGEVFIEGLDPDSGGIEIVESNFKAPVEFDSSGSDGLLLINLRDSTFDGVLLARNISSLELNLQGANLLSSLQLSGIDHLELNLKGARVAEVVDMRKVTLGDQNLENSNIGEIRWSEVLLDGTIRPPGTVGVIPPQLVWSLVKDRKPEDVSRRDYSGQWENVFAASGHISDAREIRISTRRSDLQQQGLVLLIAFAVMVILYGTLYGSIWFRKRLLENGDWLGPDGKLAGLANLLLFSMSISTPGLDAPGDRAHGFPVKDVPTAVLLVHRFLGWAALATAAAIITGYFIQ